MKKSVKIIALCLCVIAFTALFAGCDALDDMKAKHAILSEDKSTISFGENTYKKLPEGTEYYLSNVYSFTSDNENEICITDSDVPVLLSKGNCYSAFYSKFSDMICLYLGDAHMDYFVYSYHYWGDSEGTFYCNEKDYDKYLAAAEESVLDRIGFEYEVKIDYNTWRYTLDVGAESLSKEIIGHIENPDTMSKELFAEINENLGTECLQCAPYLCDSEGIIIEPLGQYDVLKDINGKAYLVDYASETASELSAESTKELKNEYYFGEGPNNIDKWQNDDVAFIGSDDGETMIIVD